MNADGLFKKSIRVENLVLIGLNRTDDQIVKRELENLKDIRTLGELRDELLHAHANLNALGIFTAVDLGIEPGRSSDGCSVVARFRENSMLTFHSGTYVQGTEGTVEASFNLNNPLGQAEQISVGLEYGSQRTNLWSLAYTIPKPLGHPILGDVRLQQLVTDRQPWSSYIERLRSGMATITSEDGQHSLSYELGWRRLSDPSHQASRSIMQQLGDQVKSALKYTFFTSALDDPVFPRNGWSLRASSEVAGVGWDPNLVRFAKHQISGQIALPIGEDSAFHLEGAAGVLFPLSGQNTYVSDRFFLGGVCPDGLRGFKFKGVGPFDARRPLPIGAAAAAAAREDSGPRLDSLGGDLSWSLMAALRFSLPSEALQAIGIRGQLFLNCGNLAQLRSARSARETLNDFAGNYRCSVGAGILWPTAIGRLEVNVAHVLRRQAADQLKGGIQFGFTTNA